MASDAQIVQDKLEEGQDMHFWAQNAQNTPICINTYVQLYCLLIISGEIFTK